MKTTREILATEGRMVEAKEAPVQISPVTNECALDRVTRMVIAAMAKGSCDQDDSFRLAIRRIS